MIPMRVRLTDEEGATQTYTIKEFRDLSHQGTREMPDGMYVTDMTFVYECQVLAFGRFKMIRLAERTGVTLIDREQLGTRRMYV